MGIADKLKQQDEEARHAARLQWIIVSAVGLAFLAFILLHFLVPMWRVTP